MYAMLKDQMQGLKKEVVEFTRELVRTPSESLSEEAAAALVEHRMNRLGYDKVFRDNAGNVIGVLYGRAPKSTLLLESHLDTIPVGAAGRWSVDPHGAEIRDGRLYGLGAADCKGGLAAQVMAGALLYRSMLPLKGNLVVAATVAEENGASVGLSTLIEQTLPELGLKPDYTILGEPTGLGLYYGHDGWLELDIQVEGANPFQVDDAVRAIYEDLRLERSDGSSRTQADSLRIGSPAFDAQAEARGVRRGSIQLARRIGQSENPAAVIGQLKHEVSMLTQPVRDVAVEVAVRQETQRLYNGRKVMVERELLAWYTDPFHPLVERSRQALAAAGCASETGKWKLERPGMGTAGGTLVSRYGIPTIGYGPGREEQAHAADEYVELASILEATYGTAAIAHSLIGIPVYGWTSDEI